MPGAGPRLRQRRGRRRLGRVAGPLLIAGGLAAGALGVLFGYTFWQVWAPLLAGTASVTAGVAVICLRAGMTGGRTAALTGGVFLILCGGLSALVAVGLLQPWILQTVTVALVLAGLTLIGFARLGRRS